MTFGGCFYILPFGAPRTKVIAGKCLLKAEGVPRMQAACQLLDCVISKLCFVDSV